MRKINFCPFRLRELSHLQQKEFELQCENLELCWLLKRVKDVGRLGRWIVSLSPFKFKIKHTRGVDNVVAYVLSRMFEGERSENPEIICATMFDSWPLIYSSVQEHQGKNAFCNDLRGKVENKEASGKNYFMHNGALCYLPKKARRRRWVVPPSLRAMLLQYYHDGIFAGQLAARKKFAKIASNFWWPGMREDVFKYVE